MLDTNIRRVINRLWHGIASPHPALTKTEREFAERLVPSGHVKAANWNIALMEFGALVCTSQKPKCASCPLKDHCAWKKAGYPTGDRSRHTQKYLGTDRFVRGQILQALRTNPRSLTLAQLSDGIPDLEQFARALASLVRDGLVEQTRTGKYRLPH